MDSRRFSIWLVICLLVSNLAVGTLSLVFLKKINQQYAVLFEHSIPVVNDLRTQYTQDSRVLGGLLLVQGGWPLLVEALFMLVMALVVTSLLITVFVPRFDLTKRLFRGETSR